MRDTAVVEKGSDVTSLPSTKTSLCAAHMALFLFQLISSVNLIITRAAFTKVSEGKEAIKPLVLAVARCVIALIIFFVIRCARRALDPSYAPEVDGRDKKSIILIGFAGVTVNVAGFSFGSALTDAITTGAFWCMFAPGTYLIARAFNMENFSSLKSFSVVIIVFGNLIMISVWKLFDSGSEIGGQRVGLYYLGCLALLFNVVGFSSYVVFHKPILKRVDRLEFLYRFYAAGCCGLVVVALFDVRTFARQLFGGTLSLWSWVAVFSSGVVHGTLPYYLIAIALSKGGSSVLVAAYGALQPLTITVLAVMFLAEEMTQAKTVGSVFLIIGMGMCVLADVCEVRAAAAARASAISASRPPVHQMMYEANRAYNLVGDEIPLHSTELQVVRGHIQEGEEHDSIAANQRVGEVLPTRAYQLHLQK